MTLLDLEVMWEQPTEKGTMAVMKADITIIAENISHFTKGKIPTKLKDGKGNPITTEGTYIFLNNRMFMLNMTTEEFEKKLKCSIKGIEVKNNHFQKTE